MGVEIERKFLVSGDFPKNVKTYRIKQGYIDPGICSIKISYNKIIIFDKINHNLFTININSDLNQIFNDIPHNNRAVLLLDDKNIARIRIRDKEAFITFKGSYSSSGTPEYEYEIPFHIAEKIMKNLIKNHVDKIRYLIPFEGKTWEVDEFINPVKIILAEIELQVPDENIQIPPWIGEEVTGDKRYHNSEIIKKGALQPPLT